MSLFALQAYQLSVCLWEWAGEYEQWFHGSCVFLSVIDSVVCDKYAFMCDYSSGLFCYTRQAKKSHPVDQWNGKYSSMYTETKCLSELSRQPHTDRRVKTDMHTLKNTMAGVSSPSYCKSVLYYYILNVNYP